MSAAVVVLWTAALRRRLEAKLAFALSAWIACVIVLQAIDLACSYLVPLDVAGTPPPDPRNARLRLLITAGIQVPAALLVAYLVSLAYRIRGRSPNSQNSGTEP